MTLGVLLPGPFIFKQLNYIITITTLCADSVDIKLMTFLIFSPETRLCHFMQVVSYGLFSGKNKKKYFSVSSAEMSIQRAKS